MKKTISFLLLAAVLLTLLPAAAFAEANTASVTYIDENGVEQSHECIIMESGGDYTFEEGKWYAVTKDVTINNRIENNAAKDTPAHLILTDGHTLTAKGGIHIAFGRGLVIYGQTEGTGWINIPQLQGDVLEDSAGIGGNPDESGGSIIINGGTVSVSGGETGGAGIGGGVGATLENLIVNGGTVTASGGDRASGIGGGKYGSGGSFTINGGTVTAYGAEQASGIGGGHEGSGGSVTINGGKLFAQGGHEEALGRGWTLAGQSHGTLHFGDIKPAKVTAGGTEITAETLEYCHWHYNPVEVEYKKAGYTVRHLKQKELFKSDYELIGTEALTWYVNNNTKAVAKDIPGYSSSFNQAKIKEDGTTVIEIRYNIIYYTISFDMRGHGAAVGPISAVPGAAVEEPEKPAAKGYLFEGWYTEAECTNPYTFTKMPSHNLTLYAKWAADPAKREDVSYVDESGITKTVSCIILSEDQENYAFEEGEWYAVKSSITIDNRADDRASGGDPAHLILTDGCSLTAKGGINVGSGKGLSIYGQEAGTGKLTAKVESGSAIGGGGRITINGGTIEATGGADRATSGVYGGPGIGGNNSDVVINGGTVTAAGGSGTNGGAGIGAGAWDAKGGSVTINGGTVTAIGGDGTRVVNGGMGIGAANGSVTINGGEITATGGTGKTGIGGTLAFGSDPAVLKAGANKEGASDVEPGEYLSDHADYPYAYLKYNQYLIIEGANQTILTTAASARFVSNAPFEKFLRVEVDGRELSAAYYTARSGSTAITFTRSYIDTLELGAHTLRIVSSDGSASTGFTVVYAPAGAPVISPADAYVNEGQQATFKVKTPDKRLTYQWYIDRNDERGWKELEGATDTSYTTSKAEQKNDGYRYKCIAKGPDDYSAESNIAVLHIGSFPVPPTGDGSRPLLWTALALLSGAALLRAGRKRRLSR